MKHNVSRGGKLSKFTLLSVILTVILCMIFAVMVSFWQIEEGVARAVVFGIMIFTVLLAAFFFAKSRKRNGLLNGFFMATAYFAALIIVSAILNGKLPLGIDTVWRFVVIAAAGMFGGILGVNL